MHPDDVIAAINFERAPANGKMHSASWTNPATSSLNYSTGNNCVLQTVLWLGPQKISVSLGHQCLQSSHYKANLMKFLELLAPYSNISILCYLLHDILWGKYCTFYCTFYLNYCLGGKRMQYLTKFKRQVGGAELFTFYSYFQPH